MISILASIPIIFILAYLSVYKHIPEWNEPERKFRVFKDDWPKIFIGAGIIATILALLINVGTEANVITSISIGAISGLLLIGSYTDFLITRVPEEISKMVINFSFILGFGTLIANGLSSPQPKFFQTLYIYPWGQDLYIWILGGIAVCFIGFLMWMKSTDVLGIIGICLSAAGLFISTYMALTWVVQTFFASNAFWSYFLLHGVVSMLAFVLVIVALDLSASNKGLGGADGKALYAMGWAFAAIVGHIVLAIGLIIACAMQLLFHVIAKPLKIGHEKELPNWKIKQFFINLLWKWKKREGDPPTTHIHWAVPFLPVMNISMIATVIAYLFITPTFI